MAGQDIVQNMIRALGQSQGQRLPEALNAHFADIDERSTADYLVFVQKFSALVNYYRSNPEVPDGTWSSFFSYDESQIEAFLVKLAASGSLEETASDTPVHLSLLLAFLELYKHPQEVINRITGKHLDFYYGEVLRLQRREAIPDRAHISVELKKNTDPVAMDQWHRFSAAKDATGVERIYELTAETVLNHASITSLRSLFLDNASNGVIRYAPIADSVDGLGGELLEDDPGWHGFGHQGLPEAETGFALASPLLKMREGTRKVTITLTLADTSNLSTSNLTDIFKVYITGQTTWVGPKTVTPVMSGTTLVIEFILDAEEEAVVDYDSKVHGYNYEAQSPLIQLFLNTDKVAETGFSNFNNVRLKNARIKVDVTNIKSLVLENDSGSLNSEKAFMPFGSQPDVGSRFMVGCSEALSKKLSQLKIAIQWKAVPESNLSTHYANYSTSVSNSSFTSNVSFSDAGSLSETNTQVQLFASNATQEKVITFSTDLVPPASSSSTTQAATSYSHLGSSWAQNSLQQLLLQSPIYFFTANTVVEDTKDFVTFSLTKSFLHDEYRKKFTEFMMQYAKTGNSIGSSGGLVILNEPYTPQIKGINVSYIAATDNVSIESSESSDFVNPDLSFYHLTYFGQMQEHGFQREQFNFLSDKNVYLLPDYGAVGELLIGLDNLSAGDSVSVLFQVAEGSADPELTREDLDWYVLCDNYWKKLGIDELVSDSTNQLLANGLIKFVIPGEATTTNTILPSGLIWLKASVSGNVEAICQIVEVRANTVEVEFVDNGNDPGHLDQALAAGTIAKLKDGLSAVKKINQPYASFGAKNVESESAYHTRVSERLRHKGRAITAWDIERIILEAYPSIHKVKCIPHAKPGSWSAPGNTMVVLVPDLTNKNAVNPLEPKVDSNTLSKVKEMLVHLGGMQVNFHVKNPGYQKIKVSFTVKFKAGYEFNYYSERLNASLVDLLSPWVSNTSKDISFGARIYKSVLIDFVEEIDYVDYLRDFQLYSDEVEGLADKSDVVALAPDAILVSNNRHIITEYIVV